MATFTIGNSNCNVIWASRWKAQNERLNTAREMLEDTILDREQKKFTPPYCEGHRWKDIEKSTDALGSTDVIP